MASSGHTARPPACPTTPVSLWRAFARPPTPTPHRLPVSHKKRCLPAIRVYHSLLLCFAPVSCAASDAASVGCLHLALSAAASAAGVSTSSKEWMLTKPWRCSGAISALPGLSTMTATMPAVRAATHSERDEQWGARGWE